MKKNTLDLIKDMKLRLNESPQYTLESFMMPEGEGEMGHGPTPPHGDSFDGEPMPQDDGQQEHSTDISGIEKELTQIRKIALSVINRLADQPTSPQYDTMKKIWNMVDKAIEQPAKGQQQPSSGM